MKLFQSMINNEVFYFHFFVHYIEISKWCWICGVYTVRSIVCSPCIHTRRRAKNENIYTIKKKKRKNKQATHEKKYEL